MMTMAFGLFWLVWILFTTVVKGVDGMSLALFTENTPPPNTAGGGLANAIAGSGLLILWATVIGTPLGGWRGFIWQNRPHSWLAEFIRFINDILLSAPSSSLPVRVHHYGTKRGILRLGGRSGAGAAANPYRLSAPPKLAQTGADRPA